MLRFVSWRSSFERDAKVGSSENKACLSKSLNCKSWTQRTKKEKLESLERKKREVSEMISVITQWMKNCTRGPIYKATKGKPTSTLWGNQFGTCINHVWT